MLSPGSCVQGMNNGAWLDTHTHTHVHEHVHTQVSFQASVSWGDFPVWCTQTVGPNYAACVAFFDQFVPWSEYTRALKLVNFSVQDCFRVLWPPIFILLLGPFMTDGWSSWIPHALLLFRVHCHFRQTLLLSEVYCFCA